MMQAVRFGGFYKLNLVQDGNHSIDLSNAEGRKLMDTLASQVGEAKREPHEKNRLPYFVDWETIVQDGDYYVVRDTSVPNGDQMTRLQQKLEPSQYKHFHQPANSSVEMWDKLKQERHALQDLLTREFVAGEQAETVDVGVKYWEQGYPVLDLKA